MCQDKYAVVLQKIIADVGGPGSIFGIRATERQNVKCQDLTPRASSFYEVFDAPSAFALSQRFEMVYTAKKASWLNMAEIELSALSKQCLDRRIAPIKD